MDIYIFHLAFRSNGKYHNISYAKCLVNAYNALRYANVVNILFSADNVYTHTLPSLRSFSMCFASFARRLRHFDEGQTLFDAREEHGKVN